jgi:uncharacterized protein (DUF433 family)
MVEFHLAREDGMAMLDQARIEARITHNPEILGGKAIIRGTRMPVELIVDFFDNGMTVEQIVDDYPDLNHEDVEAAIAYARQEEARTEFRAW